MDCLYSSNMNDDVMRLLQDYAKFDVEDQILIFKKLDQGLCQAIEQDLAVKLTVIFHCPSALKPTLKKLRHGHYQVADAIIELVRSDILEFSFDIPQDLDYTVRAFLNNSMSVNKTANELYLHRNSLQYRLKKFREITGLNIKKFKDAFAYELYLNFVQTANRLK